MQTARTELAEITMTRPPQLPLNTNAILQARRQLQDAPLPVMNQEHSGRLITITVESRLNHKKCAYLGSLGWQFYETQSVSGEVY